MLQFLDNSFPNNLLNEFNSNHLPIISFHPTLYFNLNLPSPKLLRDNWVLALNKNWVLGKKKELAKKDPSC